MGMVNQCKCDSCGVTAECNKNLNDVPQYPPDWHVIHWQVKNSNQSGSGYVNKAIFSYCPSCGDYRFNEATK